MPREQLTELGLLLLQQLESLERAGVETMPRPGALLLSPELLAAAAQAPGAAAGEMSRATRAPTTPTPLPSSRFQLQPTRPAASAATPPPVQEPLMPRSTAPRATPVHRTDLNFTGNRGEVLAQLKCVVEQCRLCPELVSTRSQIVFGVGNLRPRVVFFGEAPGADEDRLGEPFVGRSGQLLTKIIEACGFARSDVYIMNVCKCRPPGNRTPTEQETENCRPFFEKQFEVLQPEYIVCLGMAAMKALFPQATTIGKMRGQIHPHGARKVIITYHPSYLLRHGDDSDRSKPDHPKRLVWEDMKMMLADMGLAMPEKR